MITQAQIELARQYLIEKEVLLKKAIIVTEEILENIGDYYKQNELQRERNQFLQELQQLDIDYAPKLQGLEFTEEALENIAILAERLWDTDALITQKMKESKSLFQQAIQEAGNAIEE